MEFLETAGSAVALPIVIAVETLASSLKDGAEVVRLVKNRVMNNLQAWGADYVAKLERLFQCLVQARTSIQKSFATLRLSHGSKAQDGDGKCFAYSQSTPS